MNRKGIKNQTIKRLFALSGNRCAFPDCKTNLVDKKGTVFAQICHIEADRPGGERYNPNQTIDERRSFENLILLCANHHIETNNVSEWDVAKLKELKNNHESQYLENHYHVPDLVVHKTKIKHYLDLINTDLDRGCVNLASNSLGRIIETVETLNDESLLLEALLLEAKIARRKNVTEAEDMYKSLIKCNFNDPRPKLFLAELYLDIEQLDKNKEILEEVEKSCRDDWNLKIQQLVRSVKLNEKIDSATVNVSKLPTNRRLKSLFYQLHAINFFNIGNQRKAIAFVEKAIYFNRNKLANYHVKFSIENIKLRGLPENKIEAKGDDILNEIEAVFNNMRIWGTDSTKDIILLLTNKLDTLAILNRFNELHQLSDELIDKCIQSNFDSIIEHAIQMLLIKPTSPEGFIKLIDYFRKNQIKPNIDIQNKLVYQFSIREQLLKQGKEFLTSIHATHALQLISSFEESDMDSIIELIDNDLMIMRSFALSLKEFPKIWKGFLDIISERDTQNIDFLWICYYHENEYHDEALSYVNKQQIDSMKTFYQCELYVEIANKCNSWEKEREILQHQLNLAASTEQKTRVQLQLFTVNFNLQDYSNSLTIGEDLLSDNNIVEKMDRANKEVLLEQTLFSAVNRSLYDKAFDILQRNVHTPFSFQFKTSFEAPLHARFNDQEKAVDAIIDGLIDCGNPTPEQYASVYGLLMEIKIKDKHPTESLQQVTLDTYVKVANEERWYYIGNDIPLDAQKIRSDDHRYDCFIQKSLGQQVIFPNDKYSNEEKDREIEIILPLTPYVIWKIWESFMNLSKSGWSKGIIIDASSDKSEGIDLKKIDSFIKDLYKTEAEFFDFFCSKYFPISVLATKLGGLKEAIAKIGREEKGFIHFCDGTELDEKNQLQSAEQMLSGEKVYLDATSVLFLTESGLFEKVFSRLKGAVVPVSLINYLYKLIEQFNDSSKSMGNLSYVKGETIFRPARSDAFELILINIRKALDLIESDTNKIVPLSPSQKSNVWSEKNLMPELIDSCILAQKENALILTDDYINMQVNSMETGKKVPKYCSSFYLVKRLYSEGILKFEDYINYFGYLASYRFRFLRLSSDDMINTIEGDKSIKVIQPEKLRILNLPLILSEDYGVSLDNAIKVMVNFFASIIRDDSIPVDVAGRIFDIALTEFFLSRKTDNQDVGMLLYSLTKVFIKHMQRNELIHKQYNFVDDKLGRLEFAVYTSLKSIII